MASLQGQAQGQEAGRAASRERAPDAQGLFAALAQQPWAYDFWQTLRRIDALHPHLPRLGTALRPAAEALRLGQDVELDMAPSALSSFSVEGRNTPRLGVRFFGLFGPMGPMPLHLSAHVRERERHHNDAALARFADVFHHRALLLFYRAWAQAQPATHLDRAQPDDYTRWVASLYGRTGASFNACDSLPDAARHHNAATLAAGPRHAEGLQKLLQQHFAVPVQVHDHVGRWSALRPQDCTRLLPGSVPRRLTVLGAGAVAGNRVWNRQSSFRVQLGPLTLSQYERFLPGTRAQRELRDWVRQYVGLALHWDVCPVLRGDEVPRLMLPARVQRGGRLARLPGLQGRLGWTTWLGRRGPQADRSHLRVRPDARVPRGLLPPGEGGVAR